VLVLLKKYFKENEKGDGSKYPWGTTVKMEDALEEMTNWVTPS
jgi:hypothetical protein